MIDRDCGTVRERLPDLAAGRPGRDPEGLRVHLETCDECRAELELIRSLYATRPTAPPTLANRVVAAVHADRGRSAFTRPWWGLTAAAVAALALGIGIVSEPSDVGPTEVPGYALESEEGEVWSSDDGLLAGAPLFDDLTDEVLEELIAELSVGSDGGAI